MILMIKVINNNDNNNNKMQRLIQNAHINRQKVFVTLLLNGR